jgi:hypothetical protein
VHGRAWTLLRTTLLLTLLLSLGTVRASYVTTADGSNPVAAGAHRASPANDTGATTPRPRRVRHLSASGVALPGGRQFDWATTTFYLEAIVSPS